MIYLLYSLNYSILHSITHYYVYDTIAFTIVKYIYGYSYNYSMNNQIIKNEKTKATIYSVTMYDKDNFLVYSDSDSQIDYFHNRTVGTNSMIEILEKDASDIIKFSAVNNDIEPKHIKRVQKVAKALNYKVHTVHKKGIYRISESNDICYIQPYNYDEFYLYDGLKINNIEEVLVQ